MKNDIEPDRDPLKRKISILVPVCNEEWCIVPLHGKLAQMADTVNHEVEIIFIDDGSTDDTWNRVSTLSEQDKRVKAIRFRRNFGITAALMAGLDHASGEIIVTIDGNLQNDPADIPLLLAKIDEGYDVCVGWRQSAQGELLKREVPNRLINFMVSRTSGVRIHDFNCSLKAYRKEVLNGIRLYGEAHRLIPVFAAWQGAKVAEIPIRQYPRAHGHGSDREKFKRFVKTVLDLVLVEYLFRYALRPMYVFGLFGLLNLMVAFATGATSLWYRIWGGKAFIETPLPLIFIMTFTLGIMCFLMGFLAEIVVRIYYEAQGKPIYVVESRRNLTVS